MKKNRLGRTDISVSALCFGNMTFGEQTDEAVARRLLDQLVEAGINFIDTAEMYSVPPRAETYGRSEAFAGTWLKARGGRERVVIATKVVGRSRGGFDYIRGGKFRLDRANLVAAVDTSLARLQTDYIDLYYLHWSDRLLGIDALAQGKADEGATPLEETLAALGDLVKAGKLRAIAVSNETAWGTMRFLEIAGRTGLPRLAAIQNRYNLLARGFEGDLAEVAMREDVPLLPYSPLCMGVLSGKYLGGIRPAGTRMALYEQRFARYVAPAPEAATRRYVELARAHGLDPAAMALAYVVGRPFVASTIFGATNAAQIAANIAALEIKLSAEVLKGIEAIHLDNPSPCL
ncbi:MAG: aldo/keto reductase [Alphaproteobacteria bacterium]|nr:aldo/keto reductase [Alphaproteobacteria bacterium]